MPGKKAEQKETIWQEFETTGSIEAYLKFLSAAPQPGEGKKSKAGGQASARVTPGRIRKP